MIGKTDIPIIISYASSCLLQCFKIRKLSVTLKLIVVVTSFDVDICPESLILKYVEK